MGKKKELTEEEKRAQEFVEATAQSIIDLSNGVHKLLDGKLKKSAIVLLIQEAMGGRNAISKEVITKVLDVIVSLDKTFLK